MCSRRIDCGSKLHLRFGMGRTELSDSNLLEWRYNAPRQYMRMYSLRVRRRVLPNKFAKLLLVTTIALLC
ncbi:hypothetical protein GCK32_017758 [Trichostrongylus colubriformis]|uniref:Uncharacterized protein n=1 Tax=Trichostrongylus colubriformis TaxID=6319 RepID=A0AAN8EZW8_TRICO